MGIGLQRLKKKIGSHTVRQGQMIIAAAATLASACNAATIHVREGALGANDGTSWVDAFTDLHDALATAGIGDEVWVATGVYRPSDTDAAVSFDMPPNVRLYGGFSGWEDQLEDRDWASNRTTLSGDIGEDDTFNGFSWTRVGSNSGHILTASNANGASVIDGFIFERGAIGPAGTIANSHLMAGAGIYIVGASPTVRNCTFSWCQAAFVAGGGMYVWDGSPLIENCVFEHCTGHIANGGGLFVGGESGPTLRDCEFLYNTCTSASPDVSGGGMYHYGSLPLTMERCRFVGNSVLPFYSISNTPGYGGGLSVFLGGADISNCEFIDNTANYGGGMIAWSEVTVSNSAFIGNRAREWPSDPYPDMGGRGGGFMANSFQPDTMRLINCTFSANRAEKFAGVYGGWNATTSIENSIVWDNISDHPEVVGYWHEDVGGSVTFHHSCVKRIFGPPEAGEDVLDPEDRPGCTDADPQFVDAPAEDFRLQPGSPAIDAGDSGMVVVGTDLDGNARRWDDPATNDTGVGPTPIVDLGAYEFASAPPTCPGDANGDLVVDFSDLNLVLGHWEDLVPSGTSGDVTGNGKVDFEDLNEVLQSWSTNCV